MKLLGLALLLGGLILGGFGLWLLLGPPQYQATVRIEIEPDFDETGSDVSYDPYFIQTEFEIIKSEMVLSNVVARLNLNEVWSKKFNGGKKLTLHKTVRRIQRGLKIKLVRNTKLVDISFTDDDPNEAAKIANAIPYAYCDYRLDNRRELKAKGLQILEQQYQNEEKQIQTMQTTVDKLYQIFGIINITNSPTMSLASPDSSMRKLNARQTEAQHDYLESSNLLNKLKLYDKQALPNVLATTFTNSDLEKLLDLLHEKEQYLAAAGIQYTNNPNVARVRFVTNLRKSDINNEVARLMANLTNRVISEKAALDEILKEKNDLKIKELTDTPKTRPYYNAKVKLDQLREQHRLLRLKIEADKIDYIPKNSMVQIIASAEPPKVPVSPNRFLGAILLALGLVSILGECFLLKSAASS